MSDNIAILDGFTKEIVAYAAAYELNLLVSPSADLDGTFKAWDMNEQEFIRVNGWLFEIEVVGD